MDEWDADNFDPKLSLAPSAGANKWEGEDEDDDVKDNWEDEEEEQPEEDEEEKKDVEKQEPPKLQGKKPKKALADKIEEREQRMREDAQKRLKSTEPQIPMTAEEIQAEKLYREKLQKESDLRVAMETFGINENESIMENGIEAMNPSSKEEFDDFREALIKKIQPFSKSSNYPVFIEELIMGLCVNISSLDLKRLKTTLETLHQEKLKLEKGDKPKKVKGKGKIKLKVEGENAIVNEYAGYDYNDYDDFM